MVMTATAAFAQTPDTMSALLTAAVANLTSLTPTGIVTAFTAGPNGAIVTRVTAIPRGASVASGIYMFKSTDAGATQHLKDSVSLAALTPAAGAHISTGVTFSNYSESRPMRLGAGEILSFGLGVAQTNGVDVDVEFTNF